MEKSKKTLVWVAIIFAVLTLLVCTLPFLFTHFSILDFTETGQIGDTIGGIMSPFVGIIAAILTFLAFWIQYKANEEQKKAIEENRKDILAQQERYELDRFESKLSMMMNSYQETVRSLKYGDKQGRIVFNELIDELRLTYELAEHAFILWYEGDFQHKKTKYDQDVRKFHLELTTNDAKLKSFLTQTAYTLFFYGKPYFSIIETKEMPGKVVAIEKLHTIMLGVKTSISEHSDRKISVFSQCGNDVTYCYNAPTPLLQGRSSQLAPYFRQLYTIAKFIDGCNIPSLNYEKKYAYFKQLRCLMSDEEQALFYYNSISPLGKNWNTCLYTSKENMSYDTMGLLPKYRMIKNLPPRFPFFGIVPMEFYRKEIDFFESQGKRFYEHESFDAYKSKIYIKKVIVDGKQTLEIVVKPRGR